MKLPQTQNIILFDPEAFKHYPSEAREYDFMASLFNAFSESANKILENVKIAIEQQDLEQFKDQMHALKGIAGNIKAKRLEEIVTHCMSLDSESFQQHDNQQYILDSLTLCISQTNQALLEYLETNVTPGN